MAPPEYTDRILPGEAVYLAPNGRFHRAGCRYYVAPGPDATFVEGTFTEAFLSNSCKLCFPAGVPALAAVEEVPLAPIAAPLPVVASPEGRPEPSLPEAGAALAGLPPLPPVAAPEPPPPAPEPPISTPEPPISTPEPVAPTIEPPTPPPLLSAPSATLPAPLEPDERLVAADDRGARKRRKKQKLGNRPPAVTKVQVLIFLLVVLSGVGVFVALAWLLHWFG